MLMILLILSVLVVAQLVEEDPSPPLAPTPPLPLLPPPSPPLHPRPLPPTPKRYPCGSRCGMSCSPAMSRGYHVNFAGCYDICIQRCKRHIP